MILSGIYDRSHPKKGNVCVTGSIQYHKERKLYYVQWYDRRTKKTYKIYKYDLKLLHQSIQLDEDQEFGGIVFAFLMKVVHFKDV